MFSLQKTSINRLFFICFQVTMSQKASRKTITEDKDKVGIAHPIVLLRCYLTFYKFTLLFHTIEMDLSLNSFLIDTLGIHSFKEVMW